MVTIEISSKLIDRRSFGRKNRQKPKNSPNIQSKIKLECIKPTNSDENRQKILAHKKITFSFLQLNNTSKTIQKEKKNPIFQMKNLKSKSQTKLDNRNREPHKQQQQPSINYSPKKKIKLTAQNAANQTAIPSLRSIKLY